jgi:tetratricopeptide (TPR) repeat protein
LIIGSGKENTTKQKVKARKMNTKLLLFIIGLLGISHTGVTQEYNCDDAYIIFNDALKSKDYPRAYQFWQVLITGGCESKIKEKPTIITNGGAVVGKMVKQAEGPQQLARRDSLYYNFQKGIEVLGRNGKILEAFGGTYARYEAKAKAQETHDLLNESIELLQEKSKSSSVRYYYTACFYLYQSKKLDKGAMVTEYLRLKALGENAIAAGSKDTKWQPTLDFLLSIAKNFLTCDVITEIYKEKVNADPTNQALLQEAFKLLDDAKCEKQDVSVDFYLQVLELSIALEPSAQGYYGLSKLQYAKDKKSEACETAQKAYDLCEDQELKLQIIKIGVSCAPGKWYSVWMNDFPAAGEPWLNKAVQTAKQVSNTSLDPNLTMRKLAYAKAIEHCEKAKSLDSGVSSRATKMIDQYKSLLPSCNELFQMGHAKGDVVNLGSLGAITIMCQ